MKLVVLQIKDIGNCDYAFCDYNENKFNINDYEVVYCNPDLDDNYSDEEDLDLLDILFELFNVKTEIMREHGFTGHSLSVSDIVSIDNREYYCNRFGWQRMHIPGLHK